jgi:two-component system chemotaxis response regulator CheB
MIRVLVADDSDTARALMIKILRHERSIEVIGEARDGLEAIKLTCRLKPDLVTMDIQMPNVDGFAATEQIMMSWPVPIVLVSSMDNLCEAKGGRPRPKLRSAHGIAKTDRGRF